MVKEKLLRIYDKDGFRRRAACICVRSEEENEVSSIYVMTYKAQMHISMNRLFFVYYLQRQVVTNLGGRRELTLV